MFSRLFVCFAAVLLAHGTMSAGPLAPKHARGAEPLTCDDNEWRGDGRASHCEIRETKIADFGGSVDVDSGMNGGIAVIGWDQPGAFVRARVRTGAESDASAAELAKRITIETAGGRVHADGPEPSDDASWSVTLQVYVPRGASVSARTMNGGISLDGLNGQVRFAAENGGVSLTDMSGDVRGHTTNGGLAVRLDGAQWTGETASSSTILPKHASLPRRLICVRMPARAPNMLKTTEIHHGGTETRRHNA